MGSLVAKLAPSFAPPRYTISFYGGDSSCTTPTYLGQPGGVFYNPFSHVMFYQHHDAASGCTTAYATSAYETAVRDYKYSCSSSGAACSYDLWQPATACTGTPTASSQPAAGNSISMMTLMLLSFGASLNCGGCVHISGFNGFDFDSAANMVGYYSVANFDTTSTYAGPYFIDGSTCPSTTVPPPPPQPLTSTAAPSPPLYLNFVLSNMPLPPVITTQDVAMQVVASAAACVACPLSPPSHSAR